MATVTAFTVAHSITLAAATLGFIHVPQEPVEAAIALSILFVAAEIIHSKLGQPGLTEKAPWLVAFAFGLLHGFGFASALSEVGLPQNSIPAALLFFNLGVELGQLLFILLAYASVAGLRLVLPRLALLNTRLARGCQPTPSAASQHTGSLKELPRFQPFRETTSHARRFVVFKRKMHCAFTHSVLDP